jgi:hypothetical protein
MVKIRNFNWIANNGHFSSLAYGNDTNLFLLDTGVLIDLENEYASIGMCNGHIHPAKVLDRISMEHRLVITPGVLKEVRDHRLCRIGARSEISEPTGILTERLFRESQTFVHNAKTDPSFDSHRYQVYLAAQDAFRNDFRKGEKDRISPVDIETLTYALVLSKLEQDGEKIGCVNVLSPDSHLHSTLDKLRTSDEFINYNVKVIPTRDYLGGYIRK